MQLDRKCELLCLALPRAGGSSMQVGRLVLDRHNDSLHMYFSEDESVWTPAERRMLTDFTQQLYIATLHWSPTDVMSYVRKTFANTFQMTDYFVAPNEHGELNELAQESSNRHTETIGWEALQKQCQYWVSQSVSVAARPPVPTFRQVAYGVASMVIVLALVMGGYETVHMRNGLRNPPPFQMKYLYRPDITVPPEAFTLNLTKGPIVVDLKKRKLRVHRSEQTPAPRFHVQQRFMQTPVPLMLGWDEDVHGTVQLIPPPAVLQTTAVIATVKAPPERGRGIRRILSGIVHPFFRFGQVLAN
jgi:hypothetical protein